jgi:hypothetical protein
MAWGRKKVMKVCGKDLVVQGRFLRIARLDEDTYELLKDPEAVLDGVRKSGVRADIFTSMQIMPETSPQYRYPMEWDNLAILPVSSFDHWWKNQIRSLPRNRARQAEKKGVKLREVPFDNTLVQGIWEVYNECPFRQGKPFFHYGRDIEAIRKELETFPDTSIFIGAFLDNQLIGFAKMTCDRTYTQANIMNIVSMMRYRDKAPTNAIIAQAVRSCAERGIRYLAYQSFSYGKKQRDSLSDFKENNGFQRVDLPRYYIPLTTKGWIAFRLGLHKRLADRVPESLLLRYRELRNGRINRKLQSVMEGS